MGVWLQYRALLFKNWTLWKRKVIGSICEVLFPTALIIMIGIIRWSSPATHHDAQTIDVQISKSFYISPNFADYMNLDKSQDHVNEIPSFPFKSCASSIDDEMYYLSYSIITNDEKADDFKAYMQKYIGELSYGNIKPFDIEFDTIDEFEDFVSGDSYLDHRSLCFAVYLNKLNEKEYELRLRYNTSNPFPAKGRRLGPSVDIFQLSLHPDYDELIVSPSNFGKSFYNYGFLTINNLVHNYLLQTKLNKPSGSIKYSMIPMRFGKYIEDTFYSSIQSILSFFIVISYLVPVSRLISSIVQEKETKTKEIMFMMGLTNSAYWLSWITYYLLIYTIIAVLMTIVSIAMEIFTYSNGGFVFLYFWLFGLACLSFSIFLSMFFSKSRNAILVGIPLFLGSYFVSFAVNDPIISLNKKTGASILPTVCMTLATNILCQLETAQTGVQNSNLDFTIENYNFETYIGMMIADIIYFALLAVYLDIVWPGEWGVKRPWYFFITKSFWCPTKVHTNDELFAQKVSWSDAVEPVDSTLESQKISGKALLVRNLTKRFANKTAVEDLNLDIYEGQIFALLGHNGAGKTTTMSMMAGLISPTSGDMCINKYFLSKDLKKIREHLGVCPQHNILFPDLNAEEHLYLFCIFKGIKDKDKIKEMSISKLNELDMMPHAKKRTKFLSGGQKRKLSLAIALIGDSPIILLDEPTSGMDLTARRHMWDMLKNNKNGRIIILTTHYMEEADVLADRIAIMSEGKLRCCGSSMFLKSRYGVGYYLTMVKSQDAIKNSNKIEDFVKEGVQGAKMMTDYQGEITFQLPSSSTGEFVTFFKALDDNLANFGLLSYSISATTLEEVFLRVAKGDDEKLQIEDLNEKCEDDDKILVGGDFVLEQDRVKGSLLCNHFWTLTKKRAISSRRDFKTLLFEIFIPILLIIIGLSLMAAIIFIKSYSGHLLNMSLYDKTQNVFYSGDHDGTVLMSSLSDINARNLEDMDFNGLSEVVYKNKDLEPKLITSYYYDNIDFSSSEFVFSCFYDQKAYQSPPVVYNTIVDAIFNEIDPEFSLEVYNHPLPLTKGMRNSEEVRDGLMSSLVFSLGFSFIPTGIVLFITKEREVNVKHQHMISGVSLIAYWMANLVWDIVKHIIPAVVCSLIILAFQAGIYTDDPDNYSAMWSLIILTGVASGPFSYFFSYFFKSHSSAQIVMLILSFVTGSCFPTAVFVLYIFESTRKAANVLSWILKIFPNFCFGWGVLKIGLAPVFKSFDQKSEEDPAFDMNSAGGCILLLGIMTIVYYSLVILMELFETHPKLVRMFIRKNRVQDEVNESDEDVDMEAAIAEATDPKEVQVNVKKLTKSFRMQGTILTAVNSLSFNVKKEECFALLGINGAGKTTTFKMLTGEIPCDTGSAFVGGQSVIENLSTARKLIGYCPQFDALTDNLTGREHLELYANIKGIPKLKIKEQVDYMLKYMDLEQYANIQAGTYSGGNKRKLSVAMALIGNPSVVFLDEPSAGMDPEARKKMWKILGNIKKKKSAVILTTHSMEEAEALCDRMTIMVKGRLKCIGTSSWIKNKFGDGYELEIKVQIPGQNAINRYKSKLEEMVGDENVKKGELDKALDEISLGYLKPLIRSKGPGAGIFTILEAEGSISQETLVTWGLIEKYGDKIKKWLEQKFKDVEVIEHYHLMSKFKLKKQNVKSIGKLFAVIEEKKDKMKISDYSICMTSLEQIFNSFAKRAEMEELEKLQNNNSP